MSTRYAKRCAAHNRGTKMNPVDDFLKTAGIRDVFSRIGDAFKRGLSSGGPQRTFGQAMAEGAGQAIPGALVGTAMLAGASGLSRGLGALSEKVTKAGDYKSMLNANPTLAKYDAGQVQMVFNSLRSQAPSMSKDPLIAGSFVRKTLEVSPESGPFVDPQTVKLLAESQRNISQARGSRGGIAEAFRPTQMFPINPDPLKQREQRFREQMDNQS